MKATLSLNFNPDHDTVATVTAKYGTDTLMVIGFDFCTGPNGDEQQITVQVVKEGGLFHYQQAKLILAASELVESYFTGVDVPSTIDL